MSKAYADVKALWQSLNVTQPFIQCLVVDVKQQVLIFYKDGLLINSYRVSTAKNGIGNQEGSYQTPYGFHVVDEKIGANQPINMLFKARQPTGEIALVNDPKYSATDTISTRILWLSGLQKGINLSGNVDSKKRYIYIHGTADEKHLGQAVSHGCIRMKNTDILELFEMIEDKAIVYIANH